MDLVTFTEERINENPHFHNFVFITYLHKPYSRWAFSGMLTDGGSLRLPKTCHKNPAMMKLGIVVPSLKKDPNNI